MGLAVELLPKMDGTRKPDCKTESVVTSLDSEPVVGAIGVHPSLKP